MVSSGTLRAASAAAARAFRAGIIALARATSVAASGTMSLACRSCTDVTITPSSVIFLDVAPLACVAVQFVIFISRIYAYSRYFVLSLMGMFSAVAFGFISRGRLDGRPQYA